LTTKDTSFVTKRDSYKKAFLKTKSKSVFQIKPAKVKNISDYQNLPSPPKLDNPGEHKFHASYFKTSYELPLTPGFTQILIQDELEKVPPFTYRIQSPQQLILTDP
jgi:hypothetical protein